jgi:hypothetical protein
MAEVVVQVGSDLMGDIASASVEQSSGLAGPSPSAHGRRHAAERHTGRAVFAAADSMRQADRLADLVGSSGGPNSTMTAWS